MTVSMLNTLTQEEVGQIQVSAPFNDHESESSTPLDQIAT